MSSEPRTLNVLFVCSGNIMRSVVSEALLAVLAREFLGDASGLLAAESCGLEADPDSPPHDEALRALEHLGIPGPSTRSARIDLEKINKADLVVTMTRQQTYVLGSRFPERMGKYFSIIELNGSIETLLEWRRSDMDSRDWVRAADELEPEELGRGLELAAMRLTEAFRPFLRPLPGVPLNIAELLRHFSPCFHQVSGVHDPIGGAPEETLKCADLLEAEVTRMVRGLLALACVELEHNLN
jgi:protein-tyrosine phosphatase